MTEDVDIAKKLRYYNKKFYSCVGAWRSEWGVFVIFSSPVFIFIFLPVVFTTHFLIPSFSKKHTKKIQHLFLVCASLVFYAYAGFEYIKIIFISILLNYACACLCRKCAGAGISKAVFIAGILMNILLLGYYKYFNFLCETINHLFGASFSYVNILLPLGVSFFTFQQMHFLLNVYRGEERNLNLIDYVLFVTFFPQLVSGPIVIYGEMMPQFANPSQSMFNAANVNVGLYCFVIGLFKKMVIADSLSLFVDNGYGLSSYGFVAAWITSLTYTMQIYFDFSGYSDMAVGLGKMFNITLPQNFNSPYKSASIKEFWNRWHMTLGRVLSVLIYFPMGGNRKGKARTYLNLLTTFFVSGLWHGASWTFVVWGLLHGIMNVLERIFDQWLAKIPRAIRVVGVFLFVNACWVLFRAPTFGKALDIFIGMCSFENLRLSQISAIVYDGIFSYPLAVNGLHICGILGILMLLVFIPKNTEEKLANFAPNVRNVAYLCVLFAICLIHLSRLSTFIYFNF